MIKWDFNSNTNILEVYYIGKINNSDLIKYITELVTSIKLPKKLKILTDATSATYNIDNFEDSKIGTIQSQMSKYLNDYISIKNAVVHTNPNETAISFLVEDMLGSEKYIQKVFSRKDIALNWLNN